MHVPQWGNMGRIDDLLDGANDTTLMLGPLDAGDLSRRALAHRKQVDFGC